MSVCLSVCPVHDISKQLVDLISNMCYRWMLVCSIKNGHPFLVEVSARRRGRWQSHLTEAIAEVRWRASALVFGLKLQPRFGWTVLIRIITRHARILAKLTFTYLCFVKNVYRHYTLRCWCLGWKSNMFLLTKSVLTNVASCIHTFVTGSYSNLFSFELVSMRFILVFLKGSIVLKMLHLCHGML